MRPRTPFAALVLLMLAVLSCGLPAGPAPTPTAGESPAVASQAVPTPERDPLPPVDFAEALEAEVAAGTIAYEEGLIRLLRSFLGDPEVSLPPAYDDVVTTEGNSVVDLATEYLTSGTDAAAQEEMRRLLGLIFPTTEQLEAYSRPAEALLRGAGLARPPAQIDCADLWRRGFPLSGVTTYPCFSHRRENVPGVATFAVYFPAEWMGDPTLLPWFERATSAAADSLRVFGDYGAFDDVSLIFSTLPAVRATLLATTHRYDLDTGETCPILIYPRALGLSEEHFKQAVAHELFHCYQARNLTAQMAVANDARQWWSEGTATYFSNVVYPTANHEFTFAGRFDGRSASTPLYQMDYDTFGFWQFLADRWGDNDVLNYLETLPTSGGAAEQHDRLAATPGMDEVFHEFGKAYLDLAIADSGGSTIPFSPHVDSVVEVPRGGFEREFTPESFVLERHDLFFVDDTRFELRRELEGEGRDSANAGARPGAWGELPPAVNTACGEGEFILLVTSAQPSGSSPIRLKVNATGEPLEEGQDCEACLPGTWNLDNSSYLAHMGGLWPIIQAMLPAFGLEASDVQGHPTSVFGLMQMTFEDDGVVTGVQQDWGIAGEFTGPDGTLTGRMTYNGEAEGTWRIEEDEAGDQRFVVFENTSFSMIGQMTFDRFELAPRDTGGTNDSAFLGTPQQFLCDGATLTFWPDDPLGPIVFLRADPSPAP